MSETPTPPLQTFRAKVSEHVLLAGKYQYIHFELLDPHRIQFRAGQYLLLTVPGGAEKKSYSISSPPALDHAVEILVDISPHGDGSLYLASLAPGDEVEFRAPVGQFTITPLSKNQPPVENELVFVATGSGISPIRSQILDLLETKNDSRPIRLHWGIRFIYDLFWEEDFRELAENYPNFTFDIILSHPPDSWPLCRGHVTDCLKKHYQKFAATGFYLCCNKQMIEAVTSLLKFQAVPPERIHFEKFF